MILTVISASHARLVLRVYFLVTMAAIAWSAEKVLQSRARLQVMRTRTVPVHRVLGWMQGFDLLKAVWSLRQLPGGKIGYLAMVLVFSLSKLADLITTTLVQQVPIQSRCYFGEGLVFNETGPAFFTYPPANGAPYIVAHNSQYFSLNNTCPYGIFTKVNRATNFCAQGEDIIGTWSCSSGSVLSYPPGYSLNEIAIDFQNQDLMYSNISADRTDFGDYYSHFVMWASSATSDAADTLWDVRAAVQTNGSPYDNVTMLPLSCSMNATGAEVIASQMESLTSLQVWRLTFQGLMYYGSLTSVVDDPGQQLAMLLNTMIMVQGGNNILLSTPALDADQTEGCIILATKIPLVVEALVLIVAGVLLGLLILFISYALRLWSKDETRKKATQNFPDTVVAWAALAAKEHKISQDPNFDGQIKKRNLKNWVVGLEEGSGQQKLRIMPKD